jgi:hypothetical protein
MSEHSRILEKYEKMFEDGSAYKPIRLAQPQPSMAEVEGAKPEPSNIPLGEQVDKDVFMDNQNSDYTEFDNTMEERINKLKEANDNTNTNTSNVNVQSNVIEKLIRRIELLEKGVSLVMETQTKLLKEGK